MNTNAKNLLAKFPKARKALSPKLAQIYEIEYVRNRSGFDQAQSAAQKLEQWMHRKVAHSPMQANSVLELGAGTLNHLPFEQNAEAYDIVEPFALLFENNPSKDRLRNVYKDISEVASSSTYDRIISIAVLEHVLNLPEVVARCAMRLNSGGVFQAGIPSEGGLLWGTAWRLSTGLAFRLRTGENYEELMRHEHVNTAQEIEDVVRLFFKNVSISRFPFNARHASFYSYIEATGPNLAAARSICAERQLTTA